MTDSAEEPDGVSETHNIFRDGRVHVLSEECATCIFRPHERPVDGARVAGMVRATKDTDGATVVCHKTIYEAEGEPQENAICRGWFDRLAGRDALLQLAIDMDIIKEVPPPLD